MSKDVPKCAKTEVQRRQLGMLLQMLVRAGLDQKGDVETWWATCEQQHRNEWNEDSAPGTGLSPLHIPVTQPRVDMLTAQVCTVVAKQEPYMLAESTASDDIQSKLENALHKFWKSAKFEENLRKASHICVDTNKVWYRVAWELDRRRPFGGLILDVIHPRNVCIFPATLAGIEAARLVGHRFYLRYKDVRSMQKAGRYFDDRDPTYGDSPEEYDTSGQIVNSGAVPSVQGPTPDDSRIELWDAVFRYEDPDKTDGEKWYRATFAYKTQLLLSIEPYPYSRPWYFDAAYIVGNEEAYWSGVSVSRNLSGIQDAENKLHAAIYNGSMMCAFPPLFGAELNAKDWRYGYGEMIPTDAPGQIWSPTLSFKGESLFNQIELFESIADRVARVSQATQGGPVQGANTATENSIIAAGVATGLEEYIGNFTASLGDMAAFTCELLGGHFSEWQDLYAAKLGIGLPELSAPTLWEPNGKSPGNTPAAKLGAIDRVVSLAQAFGPLSGIDPYALVQAALANLGFSGADNIQKEQTQIAAQQPPAQPPLGPLQSPGMAAPPGISGGPLPGVPAATLPHGPAREPY